MGVNDGVVRILDATTQAAPKMTEALSNYGNGRMGDGIIKFMDWSWHEGKVEGRVEGAVVATVITGLIGLGTTLYMHHKLKQEAKHGRDVMNDLLDEMSENYVRCQSTTDTTKVAPEKVTGDTSDEDPEKQVPVQQQTQEGEKV